MKRTLTIREINEAAHAMYEGMARHLGIDTSIPTTERRSIKVWGVPRGGVTVAFLLQAYDCCMATGPDDADFIVDDLIDSGATRQRFAGRPFAVLFMKMPPELWGSFRSATIYGMKMDHRHWLIFPWEASEEASASDIVTRLLQYIGEDPTREGLKETPRRVLDAWRNEWAIGYDDDPAAVLKSFEDGGEEYDEMVMVRDIPIYSHCEHHLAPFFGVAHIAYIPDGRVAGLSKLARLANLYARRLQVQERLTVQIAGALTDHLKPRGVGVVIKCRHLCMESRGIRSRGAETVTCKLTGALFDDPRARAEFLTWAGVTHG